MTPDLIFTLPRGIADKAALLEAYDKVLGAPWPPNGWDALFDLLLGLWWLPEGNVSILYEDRPLANRAADDEIHASIVADVNVEWAKRTVSLAEDSEGRSFKTRRIVRFVLPER